MYRVLIVEDEDIIRKGIAYTMDWMSMDCVIAGEAANGKEGVEKILELRPDAIYEWNRNDPQYEGSGAL